MKSILLPDELVVITPVKPPPTAAKIKYTLSLCDPVSVNEATPKDNDPDDNSTLPVSTVVTTPRQMSPILEPCSNTVETDVDKPQCIHSSTPVVEVAVTVDSEQESGGTPSRKGLNGETKHRIPQQVIRASKQHQVRLLESSKVPK